MKTKKASADLIAYVLLIGFTIALAAFVTNWVIDQTKKFNPEEVVGGSKVYCEDVVLGIEEITGSKGGSCEVDGDMYSGLDITLKNKGKFTIIGTKALGANMDSISISPGSDPTTNTIITKISFCKKQGINIEIIPQIEVEEKKFYCAESATVINDDILASIQPPPL